MHPLFFARAALVWLPALTTAAAMAQDGGLKRSIVERADVSVPGREAVVARVEVAPGVLAPHHTHPGDEISYVLEGEGELLIEGRPARHLKAGDAFVVPAGTVHGAKNSGAGTLRVLGVYVVEKGQPLSSPAK